MNICPRYTPYLSNNGSKRRPSRHDPSRAKSTMGSRNQNQINGVRCVTQQSPSRMPLFDPQVTPVCVYLNKTNKASSKHNLDISADEKVIKEIGDSSQFKPNQTFSNNIKKIPSYRFKNFRHMTPVNNRESDKQTQQVQRGSASNTPDVRKNRMTALEQFYQQLDEETHVYAPKISQQKKQYAPTPSSESQTILIQKVNLDIGSLEDKETNLEETHFYFVETQQKYKQWLENIEKQQTKQ